MVVKKKKRKGKGKKENKALQEGDEGWVPPPTLFETFALDEKVRLTFICKGFIFVYTERLHIYLLRSVCCAAQTLRDSEAPWEICRQHIQIVKKRGKQELEKVALDEPLIGL